MGLTHNDPQQYGDPSLSTEQQYVDAKRLLYIQSKVVNSGTINRQYSGRAEDCLLCGYNADLYPLHWRIYTHHVRFLYSTRTPHQR